MSFVVIGASPNLFDIIKRVNEDEQTQQLPLCLDNSAIHDRLRRYGFVRYRFFALHNVNHDHSPRIRKTLCDVFFVILNMCFMLDFCDEFSRL